MSRQQTTAGYTGWIWVPFFRLCRVGDDRVEITPPILFGRGFLFDRARQVVTIRRCLFGLPLSKEEFQFSGVSVGWDWKKLDAHSVRTETGWVHDPGGFTHFIEIDFNHHKKNAKIIGELVRTRSIGDPPERLARIMAAIRNVLRAANNE